MRPVRDQTRDPPCRELNEAFPTLDALGGMINLAAIYYYGFLGPGPLRLIKKKTLKAE